MSDSATLPADMMAPTNYLMSEMKKAKSGMESAEKDSAKAVADENKALGDRADLIGKQRDDAKNYDATHPFPHPDVKPWTQKPPENNPVERFGSWASAFGILAGAVTKTGLASSLNASASAMNAMRKNDLDAYDEAHQAWKDNTEIAYKQADWEAKAYHHGWDLMEKDQAAGQVQLEIAATQAHNMGMLAALKKGDYKTAFDMSKGIADFASQAPARMQELGMIADQNRRLMQLNEEAAKKMGVPVSKLPPDVLLNNRVKVQQESQLAKQLTPAQLEKTNIDIAKYESYFKDIDDVKNLLKETSFAVGISGKLGRPVETLGELLEFTDDATRTRIRAKLSTMKLELPRMLVGASRQPTPLQMEENEKIIGGENLGSTIQNVTQRLDDMQDRMMPVYDVLVRSAGTGGMGTAGAGGASSGGGPAKEKPPAKGEVIDGWTFNGGDPHDRANWSRASGGTGSY